MQLIDRQGDVIKQLEYDILYTFLSLLTSISSMVISFSIIGIKSTRFRWLTGNKATAESNSTGMKRDHRHLSDHTQLKAMSLSERLFCSVKQALPSLRQTSASTPLELRSPRTTRGFGLRCFLAGTLCGAGVSGMHFISQAGIVNQKMMQYDMVLVALSVVISCLTSWFGFWILFVKIAPQLRQSWYTRMSVGGVLAIAVSSMHYVSILKSSPPITAPVHESDMVQISISWSKCAMSATMYYSTLGTTIEVVSTSESNAVQIAIEVIVNTFAPLCCFIITGSSIYHTRAQRKAQALRQKVLLAACVFDENGNILTTADGQLPVRELKFGDELHLTSPNRSFSERILGRKYANRHHDLISPQHPAFLHCMRLSWDLRCEKNVSEVKRKTAKQSRKSKTPRPRTPDRRSARSSHKPSRSPFLPGSPFMTPRILNSGFGTERSTIMTMVENSDVLKGAAVRFVDTFSKTWEEIVTRFLGPATQTPRAILYDQILQIGHEELTEKVVPQGSENPTPDPPAPSRGNGQMMFMVYQTRSSSESTRYEEQGYRFNNPYYVSKAFASDMAISPKTASETLRDLLRFHKAGVSTGVSEGVVYCGICVAQALPYEGLKFLVDPLRRHSIPMLPILQLPHPDLIDQDSSLLPMTELGQLLCMVKKLGGLKHEDIMALNAAEARFGCASPISVLLTSAASALTNALLPNDLAPSVLKSLKLHPQLTLLNSNFSESGPTIPSYMLCFRGMVSTEVEIPPSDAIIPYKSFQIQWEGAWRPLCDGSKREPPKPSATVSPTNLRYLRRGALQSPGSVVDCGPRAAVRFGEIDLESIIQDINADSLKQDRLGAPPSILTCTSKDGDIATWTPELALELVIKSAESGWSS